MMVLTDVFRAVLLLFLIYTIIFIIQWIGGVFISAYRLSEYSSRRRMIRMIITDEVASDHPVSVIIPAYNEEDCIEATVSSILEEDYPQMDIIVVDDGSSDRTGEIMICRFGLEECPVENEGGIPAKEIRKMWEKQIGRKRLILISKENGGKADALNCGINICSTEFCLIVDADTQVEKGSVKAMVGSFLNDERIIVCAGVVGNSLKHRAGRLDTGFPGKALLMFQQLEYYRTFYMQRILLDYMNANVIVSGAFAMFDTRSLKELGGYTVGNIGEDMELTMRLHAFYHAKKKRYKIGYVPEAKCTTEFPFSYRDYYRQRKRWHTGMIQSLKKHRYMLGNHHYGGAGIISGSFLVIYELLAPVIETAGIMTLFIAAANEMIDIGFAAGVMLIYLLFSLATQLLLLRILMTYGVEKITVKEKIWIIFAACIEPFVFHPMNMIIKMIAGAGRKNTGNSWKHAQRRT